MAKLIAHDPPKATLKSSGYTGTPTGDIELTENNRTYNVSPFATATTAIPEEEKTVTPSTVKQTVTPDSGLLKKVTIEPTPLEGGFVIPTTGEQRIRPSSPAIGFSDVRILPSPLESKTVTPSTEQQTIVPQSPAIGFSQVIIEPVTPSIDPDIQPENIKQGVDILGVQGTLKPPVIITKQITANGTYTAEDDNADGYSEVTVNIQPYFNSQGTMYFVNMVIPNTVTSIKQSAYNSCDGIQSIEISSSVKVIGSYSFQGTHFEILILHDGIEEIQNYSFQGHNCTYIALPQTVTSIGAQAFSSTITNQIIDLSAFLDPDNIPALANSNAFNNARVSAYKVANQEMLNAFEAATNWSTYAGKYVIKGATP